MMRFETSISPSRNSEVSSLISLLSGLTRFDQKAAASISAGDWGGQPCFWVPSTNSSTKSLTDSLQLDLLEGESFVSCSAKIDLIDDETARLDLKMNCDSTIVCDSPPVQILIEWIVHYLDRSKIEVNSNLGGQDEISFIYDHESSLSSTEHILTAGPLIGPREAIYTLDALKVGWNDKSSDYLTAFESKFSSYIGINHAISTSSCTGALHLALLAAGIGPGDEVIVPETTWVATASAVKYVGATPIFADIEPTAWTIDTNSTRSLITSRTKAIMPVHLYGYPANMIELMDLALEHGLFVIEDAAPAIGALVRGEKVGSFGHLAAFSFQGAKMLVTGEGGMLVMNSDELKDKAWQQQDHGRRPGTFWIETLGRKYKMSNLTAALGLAQLESVETQITQKRRINSWYREFLKDTPGILFQSELPQTKSICWMTSIELLDNTSSRDGLMEVLKHQGIDSRPVFPAISQYPIWGQSHEAGQVAKRVGSQALNLPSGVKLNRASVERVAEAIDRALRNAS